MDEFDDSHTSPRPAAASSAARGALVRQRMSVARLISRAYRVAREPLRTRMVERLLRPLGTLSLIAVASGAFGRVLHAKGAVPGIDEFARYSDRQVLDLAQFVQDVDPAVVQQVIGLLAENPLGAAALTASAIALLYRRMHRSGETAVPRDDMDGLGRS
jgi:hypothetical protein